MIVPECFTTARLLLRRPKDGDAPGVFAYGSDPEVARYADWRRLTRIEDAIGGAERAARRWAAGEEYAWRVTMPPDDMPVGGVACSIDGHRAEIGFLMHRRLWGQGLATEAAHAVFVWTASLQQVHRIQATCDVDNAASARVLEKLGMRCEGVLRRWAVRPNVPGEPIRDARMYAWVRGS